MDCIWSADWLETASHHQKIISDLHHPNVIMGIHHCKRLIRFLGTIECYRFRRWSLEKTSHFLNPIGPSEKASTRISLCSIQCGIFSYHTSCCRKGGSNLGIHTSYSLSLTPILKGILQRSLNLREA